MSKFDFQFENNLSVNNLNVVVPDYAEPITAYRVWTLKQAGVLLHPDYDHRNHFNLVSLNGSYWTPGLDFKARCNKDYDHPAPWPECECGIYGRVDEFPHDYWDTLKQECIVNMLKLFSSCVSVDSPNDPSAIKEIVENIIKDSQGYLLLNTNSLDLLHWPVRGEAYLWGKLRKGTGRDKHVKGYRGEFARPKQIILDPVISTTLRFANYDDMFDSKWIGPKLTYNRISVVLLNAKKAAQILQNDYQCEVIYPAEGALFIGGPLHGQRQIVPPMPTLHMKQFERPNWLTSGNATFAFRENIVYNRTADPDIYIYDEINQRSLLV